MHISWSFLDKRGATADALRAFNAMDFAVKHAPEKIREESDLIAEIDVLQERHRQAEEFMAWFKPAWEQLSEDERFVLDLFYMNGGECAVEQIMEHFHYVCRRPWNEKNAEQTTMVDNITWAAGEEHKEA